MSTSRFNAAIRRLRNGARRCGANTGEHGELNVQFMIKSDGSTEVIKSTGSLLSSPIATCVRQHVIKTEFPPSTDEMRMNELFTF